MATIKVFEITTLWEEYPKETALKICILSFQVLALAFTKVTSYSVALSFILFEQKSN